MNKTSRLFILMALGVSFLAACVPNSSSMPAATKTASLIQTQTILAPTSTPLPVPTPTLEPMTNEIQGISLTSSQSDLPNERREYIFKQEIQPLGVNWVGIAPFCYEENSTSPEVGNCRPADAPRGTLSDAEITRMAELAHSFGLRVMLEPQLVPASGDWPYVNPQKSEPEWTVWFASYTEMIVHYARLAEETHIDLFSVGAEMYGTTQREADWRTVVAAIRQVYNGRITYAAHIFDVYSVSWWDAVDIIGVDAYFPLASGNEDPTLDQLKASWLPNVSKLDALSRKFGKPVLFTEVSYPSIHGANNWGGDMNWYLAKFKQEGSNALDTQLQANLYRALLDSFTGKSWWLGVFWYTVTDNPQEGGPYDPSLVPLGKPAEDILRQYYGGTSRPTPMPISAMTEDPQRQLIIYQDSNYTWHLGDNSLNLDLDLNYTKDKYQGNSSIRFIISSPFFELDPPGPVDVSTYDWLEFYYKFIGNGLTPFIAVSPGYWTPNYQDMSNITIGPGYETPADNGWTRVRIPIADLFPQAIFIHGKVTNELGFVFNSYRQPTQPYQTILIDDIRFVGAVKP